MSSPVHLHRAVQFGCDQDPRPPSCFAFGLSLAPSQDSPEAMEAGRPPVSCVARAGPEPAPLTSSHGDTGLSEASGAGLCTPPSGRLWRGSISVTTGGEERKQLAEPSKEGAKAKCDGGEAWAGGVYRKSLSCPVFSCQCEYSQLQITSLLTQGRCEIGGIRGCCQLGRTLPSWRKRR